MIRKYLLLCLVMIASTCAFSQNTSTITITSEQLRTANLIFAEHQKLSETVPLLKNQITNLELINKSWEKTDSINRIIIKSKNESIEDLNKSLKKKQNVIKYGTAGSCILILLCLLIK